MSRTLARNVIFTLTCPVCKHTWKHHAKAGQADAPICPRCFGPAIVVRVQA